MLTLNSIRTRSAEAQKRKQRFEAWQAPTWDDIDFLLSLLDSQATAHEQLLGQIRGEIRQRERDCADEIEYAETNAEQKVVRMRDLCVEKVKTMANEREALWKKDLTGDHADKYIHAQVLREAATELESLQVEQEKQ